MYVYSLVSFVMYICDGIAYITTMSWIFEILVKNNFPRNFIFRGGRCNVRNIDLLIVALDKPECADEVSLAQLVNTGNLAFTSICYLRYARPSNLCI